MSETAKHTPGPWRVDTDDDDFPIISHPSWPCTRFGVEGEWEIAKVEDLYEDHEEERAANARLIAASPDLLALAKQYEAWEADVILNADWSGDTPLLTQEQFDKLISIQARRNDSIAKAEGRA